MDAKKRSVRGRRNIEKGRKGRREFDGPPEVRCLDPAQSTIITLPHFFSVFFCAVLF